MTHKKGKHPYDWYVDSVYGSDSNLGKSPGNAFATIAKLKAQTITANQKIALAANSTWRESLVGLPTGCQIIKYKQGNNPALYCDDIIANNLFSKTAGQTNVYQANITIESDASKTWVGAWENNTRLVRATSIAACDATPGSIYPSADNTDEITIYLHAIDSSDITGNGLTYEVSVRQYGYTVPTNGLADGIDARRNLNNNGSINVTNGATLRNAVASDGGFHNVFCAGSTIIENVTAHNAYHTQNHTYFVFNANDGNNENVTFTNCTATSDTYDSLGSGFFGHYNVSNAFGTITYTNCTVNNVLLGYSVVPNNATLLVFNNCTATACQFGWDPDNSFEITDCTFTNTTQNIRAVEINNVTGTITNLAVNFVGVSGGAIYATGTADVTINNSSFTSSNAISRAIYSNSASANLVLNNNRYVGSYFRVYEFTQSGITFTSDYNNFGNINWDMLIGGTSYTSIPLYQSATGQDVNSTFG